jgi:magnesium transporter
MQAIKTTKQEDNRTESMSDFDMLAARKASTEVLMDKLALGRAVVGGNVPLSSSTRSVGNNAEQLKSINESEVLEQSALHNKDNNNTNAVNTPNENVTYRERLGGFLHPRDMRRLVTPFSASNEPEIIVRRHAILLNFDPLRAIILRDRLLVVVPDGADSILVELERRLRGGFETDRETSYAYDASDNGSNNPDGGGPSLTQQKTGDKFAESVADTESTTEIPKDDPGDTEYMDPAFLTEEEQDFFDAFVETEWDEMEGKSWIDLPFELQSLDAILSCVSSMLADDVLELQYAANAVIVDLLEPGTHVDDSSQEVLRQMKNSVQEMTSRVDGFNRALDEMLEDYEDMSLMNLSRLLTHPERFIQPVPQAVLDEESDEPELILEAHLQRGHTLNNGLRLIQGQITSTEDFAERKSDTIRNRLLYINLLLQTLSLTVAIGSFIGSIFGMNVTNHYEESNNAFYYIVFATLAFMASFSIFIFAMIRKLGALPNLI